MARKPDIEEKLLSEYVKSVKELSNLEKQELMKESIPLEELPENERKEIKRLIEDVKKKVMEFFNIKEDVPIHKIGIEIYLPPRSFKHVEKSAHFDKEKKVIRIRKDILELYRSDSSKVKQILAEEITHAIRHYLGLDKYPDVEEFFGHLAKLYMGYKPGTGKYLLKKYVKYREGKWYSVEEINSHFNDIKKKIDETLENILYFPNSEKIYKLERKLIESLYELKGNLPFEMHKDIEAVTISLINYLNFVKRTIERKDPNLPIVIDYMKKTPKKKSINF